MDFKQLHYFVTAAEELHITRAAAQLGISQPVLSQQIKAMEEHLDLRLFDRKKRGLELTSAGAAFLLEARSALEQAKKAVNVAKRIARGDMGVIEIGHVGSAIFDPHLFPALTVYRSQHLGIHFHLHSMRPDLQLEAMRAGQLDIAIVRSPLGTLPDDFEYFVFSSQQLVLALTSSHPLIHHHSIPLEALKEEPFISTLDPPGMFLDGALQMYCQNAGFVPNITLRTSDILANICLVATGAGISLMPDSLSVLNIPNLRFMPIQKIKTRSDLLIVHRKYERSVALQSLLSTIKSARPH